MLKAAAAALLLAAPVHAAEWAARGAGNLAGWVVDYPEGADFGGRRILSDGKVLRDELAHLDPGSIPAGCTLYEVAFPDFEGDFEAFVAAETEIYEGKAKVSRGAKGTRHGQPFRTFKVESRYGHPKTDSEYAAVTAGGRTMGIKYHYEHASNPSTCRGAYLKAYQRIVASLRPEGAPLKGEPAKRGKAGRGEGKRQKQRPRETEDEAPAPGAALKKAVSYLTKGNLTIAEGKLRELAEAQPDSPGARYGWHLFLKLAGRRDEALTEIRAARKLPKWDAALRKLLLQADLPPDKGVKGKGKDPRVAIADGLLREANEDPHGALKNYNHAIAVRPDLWLAWALRGMLRVELYDCDGARKDLARAVELNRSFEPGVRYHLQRCP